MFYVSQRKRLPTPQKHLKTVSPQDRFYVSKRKPILNTTEKLDNCKSVGHILCKTT